MTLVLLVFFFFSLLDFSSGGRRIGFGNKTEAMSKLFASIYLSAVRGGTAESAVTIGGSTGVISVPINAAEDIGSSQMVEEEENHLH